MPNFGQTGSATFKIAFNRHIDTSFGALPKP